MYCFNYSPKCCNLLDYLHPIYSNCCIFAVWFCIKSCFDMKKMIIIICFVLAAYNVVGQPSARVYIKYEKDLILRPVDSRGYMFAEYKVDGAIDRFEIDDSVTIDFVERHFAAILSDTTHQGPFPNVHQQITIVRPDGTYDILFSDGRSAMEMNGRCVTFDAELQEYINRLIIKRMSRMK